MSPAPLLLWNKRLDEELIRLSQKYGSRRVAKIMGTTKGAVLKRRAELGVTIYDVGGKHFRPISEEAAHPFVRMLYRTMNYEECTITTMAERSGVGRTTIIGWRHKEPRLPNLEACFNVLGYTMLPHRREGKN